VAYYALGHVFLGIFFNGAGQSNNAVDPLNETDLGGDLICLLGKRAYNGHGYFLGRYIKKFYSGNESIQTGRFGN
jgi:hypothetical protein